MTIMSIVCLKVVVHLVSELLDDCEQILKSCSAQMKTPEKVWVLLLTIMWIVTERDIDSPDRILYCLRVLNCATVSESVDPVLLVICKDLKSEAQQELRGQLLNLQ